MLVFDDDDFQYGPNNSYEEIIAIRSRAIFPLFMTSDKILQAAVFTINIEGESIFTVTAISMELYVQLTCGGSPGFGWWITLTTENHRRRVLSIIHLQKIIATLWVLFNVQGFK